jgi:hypothetical protein
LSDLPVKPVALGMISTQGQPANTQPQQPGQRTLPQAPVTQAPPQLQSPPQPVSLPGRIISSDPAAQLLRIDTPQGEIDVKSSAQLAPGTDVTVSLFMNRTTTMASITVLRQQIRISTDLEQIIPLPEAEEAQPPPLKAGDTVTALQLPSEEHTATVAGGAPVAAAPQAPPATTTPQAAMLLTIEHAVETIRKMTPAELDRLPLPPGIRPEQVKALLNAPNPGQILRALPPDMQQKISAFLSAIAGKPTPQSPDARQPQAMQRVAAQQTKTPEALPPSLPEALPETVDSNLLQILRTQVGAKLTRQIVQQAPLPETHTTPPIGRILSALLPLVEKLMPQQDAPQPGPLPDTMIAKTLPRMLQAAISLPQNMFQIKIVQVIPPAAQAIEAEPPESPAPALPQAQMMHGEVESVTPGGLPIIRADNGTHFVLQAPATVPVGSRIVFEARPMTPYEVMQQIAARPPSSLPDEPHFEPFAAKKWPALAQALEMIEQSAPAVAATVRESLPGLPPSVASPSAPPAARLAPPALLFLAALRLGDVGNWLGEKTLQALRTAGHADLADRLTEDFGKIAEQSQAPLPGGWKMISMPLLHDEHLSQMQFFVRRQDEREGGGQQGSTRPVTRFLLNLSLSRLGDMQLDGLVHQKQFDLILRTGDPLTLDIRQEIMKRFAAGLDQTGMQGGVSFQAKRQNWVMVESPERAGTLA